MRRTADREELTIIESEESMAHHDAGIREPPSRRGKVRFRTELFVQPFQSFFEKEAAGGILLLVCAVGALVWANSPISASYWALWDLPIAASVGDFVLAKTFRVWINDGLMAVFFLLVGLEIKRELVSGELASPGQAVLPVAAAFGGIVVPAALFATINVGTAGARGWGVPMATDIAFALGALALLGARVPLALKVFVTALAIVDDLAAVLVIAVFYTAEISGTSLIVAAALFVALLAVGRRSAKYPWWLFAVLAAALWLAILKSGVHATVAGVLAAVAVPQRSPGPARGGAADLEGPAAADAPAGRRDATPLERLEHALEPWVAYAIVPLFALANAGVDLRVGLVDSLIHPVSIGVIAGLVLGKQAGITLFAWLAVRTGRARLPDSVTWSQIYGASWLCGIGFTMSLFIATLAFGAGELLAVSKVGILVASLASGLAGWSILTRTLPAR